MSSPPEDRTLEGLIADNWDEEDVKVALPFLEPYRESVEQIASDFEEDCQSWRDYRRAVWSPVPDSVFDAIELEAAKRARRIVERSVDVEMKVDEILRVMHGDLW